MCILGMTWILGFTYFANGSEWMAILFTLLNSLQGVFILLFHVVLNDKAKQELLRHLKSTKSEVKVNDTFEYLIAEVANQKNLGYKFRQIFYCGYTRTSGGFVWLKP